MDYLRSCYSTKMWSVDPVTGDPVQFTARWYEAPARATPIPLHHQYGSYNWTKGTLYQEQVGEVIGAPRIYDKGTPPDGIIGTHYCGDNSLYFGVLNRLTTPIPNNAFNQPVCCGLPTVPCGYCRDGVGPTVYRLTLSRGTGDFAPFNGDHFLLNFTACSWSIGGAYGTYYTIDSAPTFRLIASNAPNTVQVIWYKPLGWDCYSPITTWPRFSASGTGTPPDAVVSP